MYIKPKHEKPKPKQSEPAQPKNADAANKKPFDLDKLSRDYVLEHKKLRILSRDYVIEHGTDFDDEEIGWDEIYYSLICDSEGYFTGLLYDIDDYGNLRGYRHYKDGLKDGVQVVLYPSGKIHHYSFYRKGDITGIFYEWYENGMIKKFIDRKHDKRIECDENGKITKQGKADPA